MERTGTLKTFFDPEHVRDALEAYERYAAGSMAWSLTHKFEMYQSATEAFDSKVEREKRIAAFRFIYNQLRGYWQVFRASAKRLEPDDVFALLEVHGESCRPSSAVNLVSVGRGKNLGPVSDLIFALRNIKVLRSGQPALMTIAKFLHFFNPRLFPIYDIAVVENQVLRMFASEWHAFDRRFDVPGIHFPTSYYLRYVCWLGDLMQPHSAEIMGQFEDWIRTRPSPFDSEAEPPCDIGRYYGTAAEFIAIGAMAYTLENRS